MPLGVVTESDFELEVKALIPDAAVHTPVRASIMQLVHGRNGKKETPEVVRALIATESLAGAGNKELSDLFNVSKSSVSAYKVGATSTTSYDKPDPKLVDEIDEARGRIMGPAQSRLIKAIESITDDKLDESKVQVASAVARDMSQIIKNMQPDAGVQINNNKVVIYAPRIKEEDDYNIIDVSE